MSDFWNERYKQKEFAFGEEPNQFFRQEIEKLQAGQILFPAEGEGRNSVYAAKLGWNVFTFDLSIEGKNKALELANKNNVSVNYEIGALADLNYKPSQFDVIALVYAYFPADIKSKSPLKLPAAGYPNKSNGQISSAGSLGYYWSSTTSTVNSNAEYFQFWSSGGGVGPYPRARGGSVRCIKHE